MKNILQTTIKVASCLEWYKRGKTVNGVYDIYPGNGNTLIRVYCDQETDGGGWTVFQRRVDGTVDFFRNWNDYKIGFGDLEGEFWLGNTYLSMLTSPCCHELRVELKDFENNRRFAKYEKFRVGSEAEDYKLTVSGYSGDAGDSLSYHNNNKFSTRDRDVVVIVLTGIKVHGGTMPVIIHILMDFISVVQIINIHKASPGTVGWDKTILYNLSK